MQTAEPAMNRFDPDRIAVPCAHFIGGRLRAAAEGVVVRRPSDGRPHAGLPLADAALVDEAVHDAAQAFARSGWAQRAPRERARVLRRWADRIEADASTLAPIESVCSTRPLQQVLDWDLPFTAEGLRFFAEYADKLGGEVAATRHDQLGMVVSVRRSKPARCSE